MSKIIGGIREFRAPDEKKLKANELEAVAVAVLNAGINYYQAASVGANGGTLAALVRKGMLAKYTFANGNRWLATEAGLNAFEAAQGSGRSLADANSKNQNPKDQT